MTFYPLGRGEEMSEGEYQYQMALCESAGLEDLKNAIAYFERNGGGSSEKIEEPRSELGGRSSSHGT